MVARILLRFAAEHTTLRQKSVSLLDPIVQAV